jgi:hypothetical protein
MLHELTITVDDAVYQTLLRITMNILLVMVPITIYVTFKCSEFSIPQCARTALANCSASAGTLEMKNRRPVCASPLISRLYQAIDGLNRLQAL